MKLIIKSLGLLLCSFFLLSNTLSAQLSDGSIIVLRGDNTRFITIASEDRLSVNENSVDNAERFIVVQAGPDQFAFQASDGKFATVNTSKGNR
ncbi:MAG: hypothetical protein AAF361_15695, partial [Bacteroidota bacterium]